MSKAGVPLTKVLFEPVRSAEPPIISGMAGKRWSRAEPECWRVAAAGRDSAAAAMWASMASKAPAGSSPDMARWKSAALAEAARRACQALRVRPPRRPARRQAFTRSSGSSKGGRSQPMALRDSAISGSNRV